MSAKFLILIAVMTVAAAMVRRDVPASFAMEFYDSKEQLNHHHHEHRQHETTVVNEPKRAGVAREHSKTASTVNDAGTKKSNIAENTNAAGHAMDDFED